ncbi:hypothetical protein OOK41_01355 [Micromonospora sp. NBC_01655]|uniref:hypothetical protein n=1 Tax=Micromonospora sp. NBC_01655 TaxID=2975983 RepID=UPI0022512148|nr:hypothetical protein [Micromonospora sp. NBC_01655]MCX4468971.1 hypothetical protein [Micromonospora sp. NBC_01655]
MVYPTTGLPVVVEIAPGAQLTADPGTWPWADVTGDWRYAGGITIEEGRGDWGQSVDAGSCSLTFDNTSGDFSQYNPAGRWYGLLGRDTPLRVRIRRGLDEFGRTSPAGWGTSDNGPGWSHAGGPADQFPAAGGRGLHRHVTIGGIRRSLLDVDLVDVEQLVDVDVPVAAAGASVVTGTVHRVNSSGYYWLRAEFNPGGTMTVKITRYDTAGGGTFTDVAALSPVPGLTYTAGVPMRVRASVVADRLAIKVWAAAATEPPAWTLTATDAVLRGAGKAGLDSWVVTGNTNPTPVLVRHSRYRLDVDVCGGYVPAWVPRWGDKAGKDRYVQVTARGTLYRVQPGTGTPPKRSALRRSIAAQAVAYWPMEEGASATVAGSAFAGHSPLSISTGGLSFAAVTDMLSGAATMPGTGRLANLAGGAQLAAPVPAAVTAATAARWSLGAVLQMYDTSKITGSFVILEAETPGGTFVRWQAIYRPSPFGLTVLAYNAAGTATQVFTPVGVPTSAYFASLSVWQSAPGTISVGWRYINATAGYELLGTVSGTLAGVTRVGVNTSGASSTLALPYGHLGVFTQTPVPAGLYNYWVDGYDLPSGTSGGSTASGTDGYRAEPAHERLRRFCAEDGIPLAIPAVNVGGAARMSAQPVESALVLYQQCEDVDGGVLYERPFGLAYQPRDARYNQAPALVLNGAGDLADAPQPDPDNQGYRNRWTVNRVDGASAVAEAPDVTSGAALVYEESAEVAVAYDSQVAQVAGWRLHLSATSGLRWPKLSMNLAARPGLIDAWLNCRIGSRIQGVNPPADVAGQLIDVLLEGHTTQLGYKDFDVSVTCSPAAPWDVAVVDADQRVPADGSTLAGALAATGAATLSLASTAANGTWTTDPVDMPLDVRVGGERIRLSTITGTTSPQLATIAARGLNGIQLAWPAGTAVDVWEPATLSL